MRLRERQTDMQGRVAVWAIAALSTLAGVLAAGLPAAAQSVTIDGSVGVGGFVHPDRSVVVTAELSSPLLVTGELVVTTPTARVAVPIEVAADSRKIYRVTVPPVQASGLIRLQVVSGGEVLGATDVSARVPRDEVVVALLGARDLERTLNGVRTLPLDAPAAPVTVGPDEMDRLAPVAYLVAGPGQLAGLEPDMREAVVDWIRRGGRVVARDEDLAAVGPSGEGVPGLPGAALLTRVGRGELIEVESAEGVSAEAWRGILRQTPALAPVGENAFPASGGLVNAATQSEGGLVPGISWLLVAILGYVAVAGPIAFAALKRRGRRDLVWVVIPAISLLAVGGFWAGGRRQVGSQIARQATVIGGGASATARSAVVLVSGASGRRVLELPEEWSAFPFDAPGFGFEGVALQPAALASGNRVEFEVERLAAAGVEAEWSVDEALPKLQATLQEDALQVEVVNDSPWAFWSWGIAVPGRAVAAPGNLPTGGSGTAELSDPAGVVQDFFGSQPIADAVLATRFEERLWERVYPLSEAAFALHGDDLMSGYIFFGFTDDVAPEVVIDGASRSLPGPALVLLPIDLSDADATRLRRATGQILSLGETGQAFQEGPGFLFIESDRLDLRFLIPTGAGGPFRVGAGGPDGVEVFDWESGTFTEVALGAPELDRRRHISAGGELVVRIDPRRLDQPFRPGLVTVTWEAA